MAEKNMKKLHNLPRFGQVVKDKKGYLKQGGAMIAWGWNQEVSLDQIFMLQHKCNCNPSETCTLYLDYQELLHYTRAISMWKDEVEKMVKEAEARQMMGVRL